MAIKKFDTEYLKNARKGWEELCEDALVPEKAEKYKKRKQAVDLYIDGYQVSKIEEITGIDESKIPSFVKKCLMCDGDNRQKGYAALIPYTRLKRPKEHESTKSSSGSFQSLLLHYPSLKEYIINVYLGKKKDTFEKIINKKNAYHKFLDKCHEMGIQDYEYPFNTKNQGERSFYMYLDQLSKKMPDKAIRRESSQAIQKYYSSGIGERKRPFPIAPFSVVQIDGHKIDMLYTVDVEDEFGEIHYFPATRMWLILVLDVATRAVLGYSLSLHENYNQADVLKAVRNSIIPHVPVNFTIGGFAYPDNGGFASVAIPETEWAVFNIIMLDNAKAHLAKDVISKLTDVIGCTLNYGPVAAPETRGIIERVFRTIEDNSYHRMPSTTGSSPTDVKRTDSEKNAARYRITEDDIAQLTEYVIALYNNSPHGGIGGQAPLECMKRRLRCGIPPYKANDKMRDSIKSLTNMSETRIIRGNPHIGRRPYISYMGAEYRNNVLAKCPELIGHKIHLSINPDDISSIMAYSEDGKALGFLTAKGEWGTRPHSLKTREWANRLAAENKRAGKKIYTPLSDFEKELEERAKMSRKARTKKQVIKKEQGISSQPEQKGFMALEKDKKGTGERQQSFNEEELKALLEAGSIKEAVRKGLL